MSDRLNPLAGVAVVLLAAGVSIPAEQPPAAAGPHAKFFEEMRWRPIGPLRAGRTKAMAGVASQPFTFYIGMVNGGVWKTTNAGRTWTPTFDEQPTGSIGSIAVAASDPNIIYVGSGEGLPTRPDLAIGDGMYKSTDAGKTWTHLGLRDTQQIGRVEVDPKNPNRVFVAALGHPYGPNEERGIFRSTDGGQTFEKVLYRDPDTGGKDVDIDPSNPDIVYAVMYQGREGPWENAAWSGTGGIFKSTDGGSTWRELKSGLPDRIDNAELTIAPSNPKRLYAYVTPAAAAGAGGGRRPGAASHNPIYRSDDGGETWTTVSNDMRVGQSNEASICVDPTNPDWLIVTSQVTYKSEDGGKTWVPFKGAPGGDDYQYAWINPNNTDIILAVADQGAVVSLDRGQTWSSWYNQSTAAIFHIATDNAFPYRVCGGQQDSGSACVASRGNDGAITLREWHPVGIEEYGYAAPDPLDPDIVYGSKVVTRYDRRTGQVSEVGPVDRGRGQGRSSAVVNRQVRTQPLVFSMVDRKSLFYGTNVLWKTIDGGMHWNQISPDLTRKTHDIPKSVGVYTDQVVAGRQADENGARVIYTIGPSYRDVNRIWIGTDDGVIATTADGGLHWTDVTPKPLGSYWKVFMIEPGRFDPLTAYAAVNTLRIDDQNPHLFRTHDGGRTWTEIVNGIPGGSALSAIREDVSRKGLLFAGTETQVYVSFDDGDHWESLRLNMAPSSVRDLQVKDDDLIAGTHGRGIWILDDITPLRQIGAEDGGRRTEDGRRADGGRRTEGGRRADGGRRTEGGRRADRGRTTEDGKDMLFKPATALRVRWNTNTDTPMPPGEPRHPNPPEGAIIDYYLAKDASGPVVLEIHDGSGRLVRHYSSAEPPPPLPDPATDAPLPLLWYRAPHALSTAAGMHRFTWDVHYDPLPGGGGRGGLPIAAVPHDTVPAPTTPWVAPGQYTVTLTANGQTLSQPITVKQDPRVKTPALAMQQVYTLSTAMYFEAKAAAQAAADARAQGKADVATALDNAARGLRGVMSSLQAADVPATARQLNAIAEARAAARAAMATWKPR